MKQLLIAIKDRAIDAYMRPFTVPHKNAAIRSFQDEANRAESEIAKHPEDYDLYYLASYEEETGKFTDIPEQPELIARAQDLTNRS